LAQRKLSSWREFLLYEYYWEWPFPQTPTMFALRGDQYKYIHYYGLWDSNELYDMKADPLESRNLINSPEHEQVVKQLREQLFALLTRTGGMYIPLYPARFGQQNLRRESGSKAAEFPPALIKKPKN
jgi:N-acetylglucosamine-6-sulfatase